jgi:hypothetical protein
MSTSDGNFDKAQALMNAASCSSASCVGICPPRINNDAWFAEALKMVIAVVSDLHRNHAPFSPSEWRCTWKVK